MDLAQNELTSFPTNLQQMKNLRKLDLSQNKMTKIEFPEDSFEHLRTINLTDNQLIALPTGIERCLKLQKIYASYNKLVFDGKLLFISMNFYMKLSEKLFLFSCSQISFFYILFI